MLCKYCNADLKPEDRFCPVCGQPIELVNSNPDMVNPTNNIADVPSDIMADLDQSIFEPLPPQSHSSQSIESTPIIDVQPSVQESTPIVDVQSVESQNTPVVNVPPLVGDTNNLNGVQMPVEDNYSTINNDSSPKGKMNIVPIIMAIFAVIILGFMFLVSRSPKMVFKSLINKTYKQINATMNTNVDNMKGSISLQTSVSTNDESNNQVFEVLNNIYLAADYEIDYENKVMLTKINTKYDNEKLVDADMYFKDSKGYIFLKDVYSKYLSTDIEGFDEIFEKAEFTKDHKTVVVEAKKALDKSLKSEYFTKEKEDVKLNDKTVAATKNSIVLNDEVASIILKDIVNELKTNDKFITSLSNVIEMNKGEILSEMDGLLESLDSSETSPGEIIISIYTKGLMNEFVKFSVEMKDFDEPVSIEVVKETKDMYAISANSAGTTINGSVKLLDDDKVEFSISEPTTGTTIGFTVGASAEYNTELTTVDVSNSISIDEVTEEDYTKIMTKLMESKGIQKLMSAFEGITNPYYETVENAQ